MMVIPTAIDVIHERAQAAERLAAKFHAEAQGLICASYQDQPIAYAQDADVQQAFLRGFRDGRTIMHSFPAAPSPAAAPPSEASHGGLSG